ncbi:MAG: hypothetical protein PHC61_16980 [Chitinivibrionales bacterium]|nr:hypothetical protein [Chitinivibrionales bacterium]
MSSLKLGLAPTRRFCFSVEDAHKYKLLVEAKLRAWGVDFVNIDSINDEGLLIRMADAHAAAALFAREKVDALFAPHVNFGTEEVVATLAKKAGKPFLLWGPRDEAPLQNGRHLRDTQCGLFATSNVLRKFGVPFSYIVNSRLDAPEFERGVRTFLAAANVARNFLGARIGQVGTRPGNFYTVIVNEQELLSRFGIELVPITMLRVERALHSLVKDKRAIDEAEALRKKITVKDVVDTQALRKLAALKIFMQEWAAEEGLSAIAFKCHEDLPDAAGFYSCFANGELTGLGIPVAFETDIHGALSSLMLQSASADGAKTFFADLTIRHPDNDNAELLWHCGNFPYCLCKDPGTAFLGGHCNITPGLPGTGNFEIKGGKLTVCRFEGLNREYSLFFGHGTAVSGPYNLGTYVWMEVPDWPLWEERLMYGPYVHHVAGIHGSVAPALYEATRFIPGLRSDPVQPTESEIRAFLRGGELPY